MVTGVWGCAEEPASGGTVPDPLMVIDGAAEDAYDQALLDQVAAVAANVEVLATTWESYRPQALQDGVAEADAAALDQAIATLRDAAVPGAVPVALARVANGVSAPMPDLFAVYDPAVPAAVLTLDYLGREVALDAMDVDFQRAAGDVDGIDGVWSALKSKVIAAGGVVEAQLFAASIAAERSDVSAAAADTLLHDAESQLELVDLIEVVFGDAAADPAD